MSTLSTDQLLHAYRVMRTIRAFEERLHVEFATGEIPGFVHLYAGEEASAAGVMAHLRDDDCIASTHRGHGHCIAKGVDVHGMMAEIYGKKTGVCQGKGGSMHIADLEKGMLGANGIVGAGAPLAAGAALAAKLKGSDAVAVAFFGDGGSNEGAVFEAMNLAAVWNLPCLFVAENNGYAEATAANWSVACDHIADRAAGFGMPGVTVDGFDFFAVHEAAGAAIERARAGEGPSLIEVKLTRYYGHFEGDAQTYRDPDEVKHYRETRDCLKQFRERTCHAGLLSASDLDAIDAEVEARIEMPCSARRTIPSRSRTTCCATSTCPIPEPPENKNEENHHGEKDQLPAAINEALAQEMRRDPSVFIMGEDNAGGAGAPGEDDAWGGVLGSPRASTTSSPAVCWIPRCQRSAMSAPRSAPPPAACARCAN